MMPSDGTPAGRAIEVAAREAGARTIHVQHGFFSDLWRVDGRLAPFIDGLEASRAAVWSESQAAVLGEQARGDVSVTGNPGRPSRPGPERPLGSRGGAAPAAGGELRDSGRPVSAAAR